MGCTDAELNKQFYDFFDLKTESVYTIKGLVKSLYSLKNRVLKTFSNPGYLHCKDGSSLTMEFSGKFVYVSLTILFC